MGLKILGSCERVGSIPTGPTKQKARGMKDNWATERKQNWMYEVGDNIDFTHVPGLLTQGHPSSVRELDGIGLVTERYVDGYYGEGRPMKYYEDEVYTVLVNGAIKRLEVDALRWIERHRRDNRELIHGREEERI